MSRPWNERLEEHQHGVREAIFDAISAIVTEDGLGAVSMARIAERTGHGRTTLDRYFPDFDALMRAWHERQVANHLGYLTDIRDQPGDPLQRLDAVLRAYAVITQQTHEHHATEAAASHHGEHVANAERHLRELVRNLVAEGAKAGEIRDDVAPDELAMHCLHAVSEAGVLPSAAAVRQLVEVTLAGLRRP
jgi:AcrR family transcriptional regulator